MLVTSVWEAKVLGVEGAADRVDEIEEDMRDLTSLIETMQQTQRYLDDAIGSRNEIALLAILEEPGSKMFGKPVIFRVEWPEGPPFPDDKLKALAQNMLNGIRQRREASLTIR